MYNPAEYWEERLAKNFTFRGVGHQSFTLFYNKWLYRRKRSVLRKIFHSHVLSRQTVLDVGTGTGFFLEWYQQQGAEISGADISPTAIKLLNERFPRADLFLMDFSQAGIQLPQLYDVVNVWDVLYHQTGDREFLQFLQNCASACKVGGLLILTDGLGFPEPIAVAEHVKFRNKQVYQDVLGHLGFQLRHEYPLYRFLNRPAGNSRLKRYWNNLAAPLLFVLDRFQSSPAPDNLSVSVWLKTN